MKRPPRILISAGDGLAIAAAAEARRTRSSELPAIGLLSPEGDAGPVLYPFVRPEQITAAVIDQAATAVASMPGFDCQFTGTGWFGDQVVWLTPERPARSGR